MFTVLPSKDGISFPVKVQPGASQNAVMGLEGDFLKIRLAAPPVEGKANEALIEVLAQKLRVPRRCVSIRSGLSARRKLVQIQNCSEQKLWALLKRL